MKLCPFIFMYRMTCFFYYRVYSIRVFSIRRISVEMFITRPWFLTLILYYHRSFFRLDYRANFILIVASLYSNCKKTHAQVDSRLVMTLALTPSYPFISAIVSHPTSIKDRVGWSARLLPCTHLNGAISLDI